MSFEVQTTSARIPPVSTAAQPQLAERSQSKYKLLASEDLPLRPVAWVVKDLLPQRGVAMVYGVSASGKSFFLLDLTVAIAEGRPFHGHRTSQSPVVYVCLEGTAGFTGRVRAWELTNGRKVPDWFRLVYQPFSLLDDEQVDALVGAVRDWTKGLPPELGPPLVVIDTLSCAMPGADENLSTGMGHALAASSRISRATKGLTVLVHHPGKDTDRGPRGHSSLVPNMDASIFISRSGDIRSWEFKKVKEGIDGVCGAFRLEPVVYGTDEDGEPISSCVVRATDGPPPGLVKPLLSPLMKDGVKSLLTLLPESDDASGGEVRVPLEEWRAAFYALRPQATPDAKRNAFHKVRTEQMASYLSMAKDSVVMTVESARKLRMLVMNMDEI